MTANPSIDPAQFLSEHLERAEPNLLRSMLLTFVNALMSAEAGAGTVDADQAVVKKHPLGADTKPGESRPLGGEVPLLAETRA